MFREKHTEIVLSNGTSYIILGNYEKVINDLFNDSGKVYNFFKIGKSYISVNQIIEIKDFKKD